MGLVIVRRVGMIRDCEAHNHPGTPEHAILEPSLADS